VKGQSRTMGIALQFVTNATPSIRFGKILQVEYHLQVKLHISHLLVVNPVIKIPVTILGDT
jgi:hypothetical protein